MICSDIWHKCHEPLGEWNLRQFRNITSGISAKYHVQIMLLFVYTTTRKRFVIFTCRYFKLSWNTTALSQSNCRNFSCSSITDKTNFQIVLSKYSVWPFSTVWMLNTRCLTLTDRQKRLQVTSDKILHSLWNLPRSKCLSVYGHLAIHKIATNKSTRHQRKTLE